MIILKGNLTFIYSCILLAFILQANTAIGQLSRLRSQYPYALFQVPVFREMNIGWVDDRDSTYNIPFSVDRQDELISLRYRLDLYCLPPDTLFLLVEGVAWTGELELNGRYLSTNSYPLGSWWIPIAASWLVEGTNEFVLSLRGGEREWPNYTSPFLGVLDGIYLLEESQKAAFDEIDDQGVSEQGDSVAIIAPYFSGSGHFFRQADAYLWLSHLRSQRVEHIHFAFDAPLKMKALCKELGFKIVDSLKENTYLAMINEYPYEPGTFEYHNRFWLDAHGKRSASYGSWVVKKDMNKVTEAKALNLGLVSLMLFPLIGLLFIKLLSPGLFYSSNKLLFKPGLFMDMITEFSFGNMGFVYLLLLIKLLALAGLLTLIITFAGQTNDWGFLNQINSWSLLSRIFYPLNTVGIIFWRSFLVLLFIFFFKVALVSIIGKVFRFRGMLNNVFNLEIISDYPLILIISIPFSILFFLPETMQASWLVLSLCLLGLYFLRQAYVFFIGLDQVFGFSLGMKILYICALNVVPYLIWF